MCHFFCLNSFSKASSTTAWAWMSETSPTSPTASWPIISGSITSTTLTTWGRLVCSLTGLIKLHDRFTKYQILNNSICCFVRFTFFCVNLYQNDLFFTSHVVVYLSLHLICLFNPHLSLFFLLVFPPISILLHVLACARMNVCLCFTGSDVPVCAGIEGRLGQHHVSWFGFSGSGPAGNALHVTCSS